MPEELTAIADALYALPLADFTSARDARVTELKATKELADDVKKLKKPSLAAWVVNLLVRREADQLDKILSVGAALRAAQENMSGDDLRALTRQRRQVTAAMTQTARSLARENGVKVTESVADQIEATLTAAMLDERCALAVRSGLLIGALATTGVGSVDLSAAVALPEALGFAASPTSAQPAPAGRPELRVVPDPEADQKAKAAAEAVVTQAQAEVAQAQEAYDSASSDVAKLEARSMQVQAQIDELKTKLAELEGDYDEVDDELGEAEDTRTEASQVLDEATTAQEAAVKALAKLSRPTP